MIQKGSLLNVIDNSGAKEAGCIHVFPGFNSRYAFIGSIIVVSIKSLRRRRKSVLRVKKGDVLRGLVVRTCFRTKDYSGRSSVYLENSIVLLTKQNKFVGTRVFGPIPRLFRNTRYSRLFSLSSGFIY